MTLTITGAKAGDAIKVGVKSLSNGAFRPVPGLTDDYIINPRLLKEIVNVPVKFLVDFKMTADSGFDPAQS